MSYNLLKGKKGLIFGALNEDSIAWKVAERAVEEGAEIVLTNTPVSIRMGTINQLAEACGAIVVPADATSVPDLENLIEKTSSISSCIRSGCPRTSAKDALMTIWIMIF